MCVCHCVYVQRPEEGIGCHPLPLSALFPEGSLTEPGVRLVANSLTVLLLSSPVPDALLPPHLALHRIGILLSTGIIGVDYHTLLFPHH